jgi:hypothetical protein
MPNIIKLRRDTATAWSSINPVLASGEVGIDTTNNKIKIGNGSSTWSALPYTFDSPSEVTTKANNAQSAAESTAASALTTHEGDTSTHGVTTVAGVSEAQVLTNKTIDGNNNTITVLNSQTTATASATASTIVLRDSSGDTAINQVTLGANPTSAMHAVTKQYADDIAAGIHAHEAVKAATTGNLSAAYTNGTSDASGGLGIGAILTASSNGAISIDGYSAALNDRILVKDQTNQIHNGIYKVTTVGDGSTPWVLTRTDDANNSPAGELNAGDSVFVLNGTANANDGFVMTATGTSTNPVGAIKIGTDNVNYTQFTGSSSITASAPLDLTANVLTISAATTSAAGSMSATDKAKIDALEMPIAFHIAGTLSTGVKQPRFMTPIACTLVNSRAYAGGGSGVTYRLVKVSGGSTTTSNTSATVGNAVVTTALTTVTSLAVGDTLQVEIVSAGTSGADLSVTVEATY